MKTISILLLCAGLVGCGKRSHLDTQSPNRHTVDAGTYFYIIHDHQTGKEYLCNYQGGIIEVEPTKP